MNYNLIKIPYSIHMLLHFIRLVEFQYIQDALPIIIAYSRLLKELTNIKQSFKNMLSIIDKYIVDNEEEFRYL